MLQGIEVVSVSAEHHSASFVLDRKLIERLEERFADVLRMSDRLSTLIRSLEARGVRYCVFGGWVRDIISELQAMPLSGAPRDIDLVVRGIEVEDILPSLPSDIRPTIFGGVQSNSGPVAAFFPRQGADVPELLDGGMLDALHARTLAFNCAFLPFPVMQCARLAAYAGKLSLNLAPAVRVFMEAILSDQKRREQVSRGLSQYYPPNVSAAASQVLQALTEEAR